METDGAAAAATGGASTVDLGSSQSLLADLLSVNSNSTLGEDLGTSTVAIFVLFGASTFAAVGMFSKTWLLEDYRGVYLFVPTCSVCNAEYTLLRPFPFPVVAQSL
jgi:hypothetical protein